MKKKEVDKMKAIQTKYLGPTNFKGSRIKAYDCDNNQITIPYPYDISWEEDKHKKAAMAFMEKMGWTGEIKGGSTKTGYVFVFV